MMLKWHTDGASTKILLNEGYELILNQTLQDLNKIQHSCKDPETFMMIINICQKMCSLLQEDDKEQCLQLFSL
jgi:hypothetical protein